MKRNKEPLARSSHTSSLTLQNLALPTQGMYGTLPSYVTHSATPHICPTDMNFTWVGKNIFSGILFRSCLQVTLVIKFLRPRLTRWGLKNDGAAEIPPPFLLVDKSFGAVAANFCKI